MTKVSISLAQLHIELSQPDANLEQAISFITEAAKNHSNIILFPELWSSGYDLEHAERYALINADILETLSGLARSENIAIGGSLLEKVDSHFYNTFYLIDTDGKLKGKYRKIHLFRLMNEDRWLNGGDQPGILDFPWGLAGMGICYDLRFPELFRHYALKHTKLVLLPSEWPLKRIDHWKVLLKARAIENQMFIAAVNTVGDIGGEIFGGSSAIISPWGEIISEEDNHSESLLTGVIDLEEVDQVRKMIPIFEDRRPDVYCL